MDASVQKSFFDVFSPLLLSLSLTGVFGLLTGIYQERVKNKSLLLTYTISFQSLGTAIKDKFWGEISISHNNRSIKHLNLITIVIKNTTRSDSQSELVYEAWLDNRSQFLGYSGHYDTGNSIQLESEFGNIYAQTAEDVREDLRLQQENENHISPIELDSRLNFVQSNRKLALPVFNRKSFVTVNFLIENFDGVKPQIYMSILQKSTKLVLEAEKTKEEQTKKIATKIISIVFYILGLFWAFSRYTGKGDVIASMIVIGILSNAFGYGLYFLFTYLKKFFW